MAKPVYDVRLLRLKVSSFGSNVCNACDRGMVEDIRHLMMQCRCNEDIRVGTYTELHLIEDDIINTTMSEPHVIFYNIMGRHPEGALFESMIKLWRENPFKAYC